jgi:hypothetical protein
VNLTRIVVVQNAQEDATRKLRQKERRRMLALKRTKERGKRKRRSPSPTSSSEDGEDSERGRGREKAASSTDGRSEQSNEEEVPGEDPAWDMARGQSSGRRKRKQHAQKMSGSKKRMTAVCRMQQLQQDIREMNRKVLQVTPPPERQQHGAEKQNNASEAESASKLEQMRLEKEIKALELETAKEKTKQLQLQVEIQQAETGRR